MNKFCTMISAIIATTFIASVSPTYAQQKSRVMPLEQVKGILKQTKSSGWISFKNVKRKQQIYFTHLQSWHCGIKEIRYSYNSKDLDRLFPVAKCIPQLPNTLPGAVKWILVFEKLGTAKTVAVQVLFDDDTLSDIAVYEPCEGVGERVGGLVG
jgi:hypothetical protein